MQLDVLIRLDAGSSVGLGHLRRCLALAIALRREKVKVAFAVRDPKFVREWTSGRFPVIGLKSRNQAAEIPEMRSILAETGPALLIVDHYAYRPESIARLKSDVRAIAYVDDMARWKSYPVNAIINHNVDAYRLPYPKNGPKLFLGTDYSLMAESMERFRKKKKKNGLNLFMTLGGSTSPKDLRLLLNVFRKVRSEVKSAAASIAPGYQKKSLKPEPGIRWVKPHQFVPAMSRCNLALSASGVTTYELACLGIPSVLITAADNQAGICKEMAARQCAVNGGWLHQVSAEKLAAQILALWKNPVKRNRMAAQAKKLVGTQGPLKLARALKKEFLS